MRCWALLQSECNERRITHDHIRRDLAFLLVAVVIDIDTRKLAAVSAPLELNEVDSVIVASCSRVAQEVGACRRIRAGRENVLDGFVATLAGVLRFDAAADGLASFAYVGHISQLPRAISLLDHRLVKSRQTSHGILAVESDVVFVAKEASRSVAAAGNKRAVLVHKRVVS